MFKKHKFQQTEYPTKLEKNRFYEHFDDKFRKILKRRKLTKEFIELLEELYKHGWGEDGIISSLEKDRGIEDVLRGIRNLSYSGIFNDYNFTIFKKIGETTINCMLDDYTKQK